MGREYSKKRPARAHSSAPQQILVMAVCFLLGYFTATVFDIEAISRWLNAQVLAPHESRQEPPKPQPERQAAVPPKPKFEFYTLLTNDKTPNSQSAANAGNSRSVNTASTTTNTLPAALPNTTATSVAQAAAVVSATAAPAVKSQTSKASPLLMAKPTETRLAMPAVDKATYSVQVAAFKARYDAEHMKGLLILKGFNVNVIPIHHASKGLWFRVVVGPYANRSLAQKAQMDLARNTRLRGMITAG